jgi:glucosamine--fructose-6-phosphate aminotransferase (isomerizing)
VIAAFRTRLMLRNAPFIVISHPGAARTRSARAAGVRTIAIVNATSSPVADEAEFSFRSKPARSTP